MLTKAGEIVDRREMLRVKLKSLAEEARIIRKEEGRLKGWREVHVLTSDDGKIRRRYVRKRPVSYGSSWLFVELWQHRVQYLGRISRNTHIAYAIVRGRDVTRTDGNVGKMLYTDWAKVREMVEKYGPVTLKAGSDQQRKHQMRLLFEAAKVPEHIINTLFVLLPHA